MKKTKSFTVLDLFSGAGGMSLGFQQAGFTVAGAVEYLEEAADTHEENFKECTMIKGDIRKDSIKEQIFRIGRERNIDVIIGGFPCQGFSIAGNRNPLDPRSQLYREYLQVVAEIQPPMFVMENVKGLLSVKTLPIHLPNAQKKEIQENIRKIHRHRNLKRYKAQRTLEENELKEFKNLDGKIKRLKKETKDFLVPLFPIIQDDIQALGYTPSWKVLNAADFGTPQIRKRIFIVGTRNDINIQFDFPRPTHSEKYTSAGEAIGDLEDKGEGEVPNHDFTNHSKTFEKRLEKVKPGKTLYKKYRDAWWRLVKNEPSRTVKENHGGVFIHYGHSRVLTPRELARLQDFPDQFVFKGAKSKVLVQIGNAVPVKLAKAIANAVKKLLQKFMEHDETVASLSQETTSVKSPP